MLIVSMPTYQTPWKLLRRAANSVLAQTYSDLHLVIVSDGDDQLRWLPEDDRVTVYYLPENRGRYFADAVVTEAIKPYPDVLWAVHDADDWSDRHRFKTLIPEMEDGAAVGQYWRHRHGGKPPYLQRPLTAKIERPSGGLVHLAHWVSGVYTSERVQRAGGIHPGFRVGFDTLFVRMVVMTGPVGISEYPGYHWCQRNGGSLTTASATKFGSPARLAAKRYLQRLDEAAWENRQDPGAVIRQDVPADLRAEVEMHAAVLREVLPVGSAN
jgi:glycosyltransferase involved in cell wall biosynthesis